MRSTLTVSMTFDFTPLTFMAGSAAMFIALKPGGIVYFVIDMLIKRAKVKNKSGVKVSFLL